MVTDHCGYGFNVNVTVEQEADIRLSCDVCCQGFLDTTQVLYFFQV